MAMSINSLKIFINVADSGSITRTAQALFISQPAVSKAILSIEEEPGAALFVRDKKNGLKLTDTWNAFTQIPVKCCGLRS